MEIFKLTIAAIAGALVTAASAWLFRKQLASLTFANRPHYLRAMATVTMRIRAVFSPDDRDAITVLRLAAASSDLETLLRMLLDKQEDEAAHATRRYVLRMSTLHLSDVKKFLEKSDFDRAVERCARRRGFESILDDARKLRDALDQGPLRDMIGHTRNRFTAHYDPELIRQALAQIAPAELTEVGDHGAYFNVVDRLFDVSFGERSHAQYQRATPEDSVKAAVGDIQGLHELLIPVVQALVTGLFDEASADRQK